MKYLLSSAVIVLTLCNSYSARADEVTLVAPGGIRAAVEKLIPGFEQKTGHKVKATFGSGLEPRSRSCAASLSTCRSCSRPSRRCSPRATSSPSSETPLATVSVGVAVRTGDPKPDISTPDAVKRMLLAAKSISYPNAAAGAAAGVSFNQTLEKLGIAEQMKPKIKLAQGGAGAMALLAKGEVEIGLTFVSEIITEPGVEVVGPLPREISPPTALVGFVSTHAKAPEAARALLRYLSSPEAAAIYKALGMQPGR